MYSTRYDNLDRGVIKSFPLGITQINVDNSPVHVTVLLSDLNTVIDLSNANPAACGHKEVPRPMSHIMVTVTDNSCACEQQQGNINSMLFAVCNVHYIVDISSSDRIAREYFRFIEHRF